MKPRIHSLSKRPRAHKLEHKEVAELVDVLRRQFIHQTPKPIFEELEPGPKATPKYMQLRMIPKAYYEMIRLIDKAGGWELDKEGRAKVAKDHEARARKAYGDGERFDFTGCTPGDLYEMYRDVDGVKDFEKFRAAIGEAIKSLEATEPMQ